MLLPSDVARLVLGYLQQERLLATCRSFILESSDLKEYAEHCTGEGFVPACLLSLFGKNLITILNEYIAMKSKEATNDVPAMMSSLWKKLDYTLSQIRTMQMSSGFAAHQRSRTRCAIADMKKQRCLQQSSSNLGVSSVVHPPGPLNSTPMTATQVILKSVVTPSLSQTKMGSSIIHQAQVQESHVNADSLNLVSTFQERKLPSNVMSPVKRKNDSQKKKTLVSSESQSSNCDSQDSLTPEEESSPMEEESEQLELMDSGLPQMIIENAREKILSNKCLQEKLAENINKFLGSDGNISQAVKQAESGPAIQESSIDEFLNLQQGEIHMTEEAIHEILEQTESDPAFQGLFDVFDFGKTKVNRNATHGLSTQNGEVENTILVDEENLQALECYIATKELGDNPQGCLSYPGDDSKEASILKADCSGRNGTLEERFKMEGVVTGEFLGSAKETSNSVSAEAETYECQSTIESVDNHVTHMEFSGGHHVGSYNQQETAIRDCRIGKDSLRQDIQTSPELQYDHIVTPQIPLSDNTKCISVPDNISSEKTNAELLIPPRTGDSEILTRTDIVIPSHSAEFVKSMEQISEQSAVFPEPDKQNQSNPVLSQCQSQEKIESDSTTALGNTYDPDSIEVQLEVVDTSNSLHSNDQPDHHESCPEHQMQTEDSGMSQVDIQKPSSSTKTDTDGAFLASDSESPTENHSTSSALCPSPTVEPMGESSPGNKVGASISSSTQATSVDPSSIVSLKIIISDDPFLSSETELNNAVSSITGKNMPTIILSSPAKSPAKITVPSKCVSSEESERIADAGLIEQNLLLVGPQDSAARKLNVENEECTVFSISGASNVAKDGGIMQLMPATTTPFTNSNSVYIATCMTEPAALSTSVTPSNLVMLPSGSTSLASQISTPQPLRTPPRTNGLFTMNPPMSPNFPHGSAIIIASPVQPVLQGMVGMIPVSILGQGGNAFSDPSQQILHLPIQTSLGSGGIPKLPLPPKSQRIPKNKSNTGKLVMSGSEPLNCPGSRAQRIGSLDKNACGDAKKKLEIVAVDTTSPSSKQNESHRRVLFFDKALAIPVGSTQVSQKERTENPLGPGNSPSAVLSSTKIQSSKRERERTLPRILCKPNVSHRSSAVKENLPEKKGSSPGLASDVLRKQTANKENELERNVDKTPQKQEVETLSSGQQNQNEKNTSSSQELSKKQGLQTNTNSKNSGVLPSKEPKKDQTKSPNQSHSLASPLAKQAVEMLHDIQRQSPASKLPESGDLPVPRTPSGMGDRHTEDTFDIVRTPTCRRYSEDSTTPRIMVPPATPDLPACSPASETSSENSVSMAAHTLMILSRAAIARTSTALKDNTQPFKSLKSVAKKRKQEDVECEKGSRPANKKDLQNFTVPIKKKKVKQKKLPVAFPAGMDVDKFLLSLHYDE
ncbi:protein NPAT isoform X1 [Anolis carolinensis]|uniref:protein NPAT isoform X1 n=1 Tax=Anolis carolinensis TaxID=28377 RepID=UPI000462AF80|nr:PREDICTED: protein NPAT isoform X2 [Anolis carolinensis]|eukprot:XP_008120416.1 PREDICTED: protein NPAT isoform X2 [Anolis carolinensis]